MAAETRYVAKTDHSMKFTAFVTLWPTLRILGLASTKLTKVLSSPWGQIGK